MGAKPQARVYYYLSESTYKDLTLDAKSQPNINIIRIFWSLSKARVHQDNLSKLGESGPRVKEKNEHYQCHGL